MDTLDEDVLQSYFGEYLLSAKSYLTTGRSDMFFHDVAKFLLEVAFVSARHNCMPKQRAGFIIAAYENETVEWGYLTVVVIREQLHNVERAKPM